MNSCQHTNIPVEATSLGQTTTCPGCGQTMITVQTEFGYVWVIKKGG